MKHALNAFLLLALVTTMAPQFASAGPEAAPRVGLVLAGGGARGLAHIGVIKYLEEHGIRVDAIAGTSMGAVVGGMYASGLDAARPALVPAQAAGSRLPGARQAAFPGRQVAPADGCDRGPAPEPAAARH